MAFYFDITAPYPGGQSAPYIPRFEPLNPFNDGTTGQGAGQGLSPNINLNNIIPKDQENAFYALGSRFKDLAGSLDAYRGAIERANSITSSYNSKLNDYNANINSLGNLKNQRLNALNIAKRLKELIRQEKEKKQRFSKELRLFFDFQEKEDDNQDNIFKGFFKSKEFKALDAFLVNPYAIFPKGVIFEYHNPGSNNYNPLNAFNPMDGINNQFKTNALNQVLDNSYQKFLAGNDSYNALGDIEQVKALKFYDLVLNFNLASDKLENALFFKQISQYSKGLRLKILNAPSSQKALERLEKLENTIKEQQEQLKGKDLNTLQQEIEKEQENALKLKESIKAIQNHEKTLKNALNQKEQAKNPIQQQKQNLENQKQPIEREKHNQESAKWQKEQEKQNLNNEINAIGNERITMKEFHNQGEYSIMGIRPVAGMAVASFRDANQSVKEIYQKEKRIYEILGFWRLGVSKDRLLKRFLELSSQQQNELSSSLMLA
ncbi:hypothetical protein [Helicobacter pylori]|uniref:hypothetical protein n=1 Tax=Helicobacter pylori TaxID=210 RepID=UPI001FB95016|nr:hypothetical protein [Helicobacter pylori]